MVKIQDDPPLSCQLEWFEKIGRSDCWSMKALSSEKLAGAEFTQGILSQFLFGSNPSRSFAKWASKSTGFLNRVINWFLQSHLFVGCFFLILRVRTYCKTLWALFETVQGCQTFNSFSPYGGDRTGTFGWWFSVDREVAAASAHLRPAIKRVMDTISKTTNSQILGEDSWQRLQEMQP